MRSKFKWILTLVAAFLMQFSFAQEKTISGTVSGDGMPLPGATVLVKGTKNGTTTDFDGRYSIKAKQGDVLEFSYVGFKSKSVTVGTSNSINASLENDTTLPEVVIVSDGYRATSKPKQVSAVTTVTSESIENRPNVNFLNTLQGQVAGANFSTFSGQPGTNKIDVLIRGLSSPTSDSTPLYVIDGVPLVQGFFRNLNPNEIESVTVLKDAAATAIYGNRGTNGVIVITTKKGKFNNSFAANYSSSYGLTEFRGDDYSLPTAVQHLKLQRLGFDAGVGQLASSFAVTGRYLVRPGSFPNGAIQVDPNNLDAYDVNTDWQSLFFRTGVMSTHDMSFTSGGENLNNYTSIGYLEQDGIAPTTGFKRVTLRSNFQGKNLNNKFTYGLNIFGAYSRRTQFEQETRGDINNNVLQNPLTGYINSPRFVPASLYQNGQQLNTQFGGAALDLTPLMLLDLFQPNSAPSFFDEFKTIITSNLAYKLTDDLTISATTGIDYANDARVFAIGPNAYLSILRAQGANQPNHGLETMQTFSELSFNHTNKINYKKVINEKHTFDVSAFSEIVQGYRTVRTQQQIGLNPLTWEPGAGTGYIVYNPATQPISYRPTVGASKSLASLLSFFAALDYDYDEKYGFAATIRRDGSYRFDPENRWGTFWSVAGRWNISKERFLADNNTITDLKLRASYGLTGNQNVLARDVNGSISPLFIGSQLVRDLNSVQVGYNNSQSFGVASFANRDLKWETTKQWNIGLDFGIKRRLSASVDVYNRLTEDIYYQIPISSANGITSLSANNGSVRNRGVELDLKYDLVKNENWKVSVFANGGYNQNMWTNLGVLDDDGDGFVRVGTSGRLGIGSPLGEYFVVPYAGVNPANGNLLFLDINGNLTENPVDGDRRATNKSAIPIYTGGFGFNSSYKGFFLDVLFTYSAGAWRNDPNYGELMDIRNANEFPVSTDLFNAWTPTNRDTNIPSLTANNYDAGDQLSDRFIRDASFLRLRNISVGYNVPSKYLENVFIKSLRFRAQFENYFTWTKWRGFDPESVVSSLVNPYPTPKIATFGVDLSF